MIKFNWNLCVSVLFVLLCSLSVQAQNPKVQNGVATYTANKNIGSQFLVPDSWDKIVINANVTLTGSFYMPTRTRPIEIMGKDWNTSVIKGTDATEWHAQGNTEARQHSAIRCDKSPDVYIHDLKSLNPDKFHISAGFGYVTVDHCRLIDNRGRHTTDGVHGGRQKVTVKNCYIDTHDDALYLSECVLVENTTIVHNKNGGPLQVGWGYDDFNNHTCIVRNVKVIDAYNGTNYNHGVVSWARRDGTGSVTINVDFQGTFTRETKAGAKQSHMYQIGRWSEVLNDGILKVTGECRWSNSFINYFNGSSKLIVQGCDDDSNNGGDAISNGTYFLKIRHSNKYVEVGGYSTSNGGNVQQWNSQSGNNKKWKITKVSGEWYKIENVHSGKVLDVSNFSTSNGGNIHQWNSTGNNNQQWKFVEKGSGWYQIISKSSGKALDVEGGVNATANGVNIHQWTPNNNHNQQFQLIATGNNSRFATSIEETPQLKLFPNPSSDFVNIAFGDNSNAMLSIFSIMGKRVFTGKLENGKTSIDVSNFSKGSYIINIQSPEEVIRRKFIVE